MSTPVDEIHASLSQLSSRVLQLAPHLRPPVCPAYLSLSLSSLFSPSHSSHSSLQHWLLEKKLIESDIAVQTSIDYARRRVNITSLKTVDATDGFLLSVSKVAQSMVTGSASDHNMAVDRFLAKNGYAESEKQEKRYVFNEVYNLSYAMGVLVSNVPGFTIAIGEHTFPLDDDTVNVGNILDSVYETKGSVSNGSKNDSDDDSIEKQGERTTKKRKHKRSKKK